MRKHSLIGHRYIFLYGILFFCLFFVSSVFSSENWAVKGNAQIIQEFSDAPLADYQSKLLDFAFRTASAIPKNPHIKDRSRAQESVVTAFLELDQLRQAFECIDEIDDWRRGFCYADLAFYCAQHNLKDAMQYGLQLAEPIAEKEIDWRRDRIRIKIAQSYTWLGQTEQSDRLKVDALESEAGKVEIVQAMRCDEGSFDLQMAALDQVTAQGDLEGVKYALEAFSQLYNCFYDNPERRVKLEEKIKEAWAPVPIAIRIERLFELAKFALNHSDTPEAQNHLGEAKHFVDEYQWPMEYRIGLMAQLAGLRFQAGEKDKARRDADAALVLFHEQKDQIVNIWRAGALRPLAEAYQAMGDTKNALSVYKKAVEEGVENPNSRPRAEDLTATCISMALHAVEPDAELWARIQQIFEGLGQPW